MFARTEVLVGLTAAFAEYITRLHRRHSAFKWVCYPKLVSFIVTLLLLALSQFVLRQNAVKFVKQRLFINRIRVL